MLMVSSMEIQDVISPVMTLIENGLEIQINLYIRLFRELKVYSIV
jgi:hypothetical protein